MQMNNENLKKMLYVLSDANLIEMFGKEEFEKYFQNQVKSLTLPRHGRMAFCFCS